MLRERKMAHKFRYSILHKLSNLCKSNKTKGFAMPLVMIAASMVFLLSASAIYIIANQTNTVSREDNKEDALNIAEAGYNYYLWQLNNDTHFYMTGLDADGKLIPETYYNSSDNPLWNGFPKDYKPVEFVSGGKTIGYYKLSIIPPSTEQPVVTIRSTGWTSENPDIKKTIEVKIHKRLFTNYVLLLGDMKTVDSTKVYWGDGEQIKGPFFTNGSLLTKGSPVFYDDVLYVKNIVREGPGQPVYKKEGQPQKTEPLVFPSSNSSLAYWGEAKNGGYTYKGRTCILLNGSTLKIRNVNTNNDNISELGFPRSSVIYVKGDLYISGVLDGRLTILVDGDIYITRKDPTNYDFKKASYTGGIKYANPNVPTVESKNPANPSDDMLGLVSNGIVYVHSYGWPKQGGGISKVWDTNSVKDITIKAALFGYSSNSYYTVQRFEDIDDMGYIRFTGSQAFSRVGATYVTDRFGRHGYREDNTFDLRMLYDAPPHFLEPENAGWEVKSWREVTN